MKKIRDNKILNKVLSATLASVIAVGSTFVAMPVLHAHAADGIEKNAVTQSSSVGTDMALGLGGLRDPVNHNSSSGSSYVPSDYIYLGNNNRGAMLWRVLDVDMDNLGNVGNMFIMSEYLEPASVAGKSYDESYLSYFTEEEKAIFVQGGAEKSGTSDVFGRAWTEASSSGYLFAPSAYELERYVANYSGAPVLRAYTDASRSTVGNWWLRSESDGGVGYVTVAGVVDSETNYEKVFNYNRIAANVDPSDVVFSTRIDGGWRLALVDEDYDVPVHQYDFAAWITDVNGNDVKISYVNAKPKDVSDEIRELVSAIIVDADGNVKHYSQMGEVDYTEEKRWPGWWDQDKDGDLELLTPAALYPYHGSVHLDISGGIYDPDAGDKIYVFWEKAYSSRDIDANPNLAYQTTMTSKLVEVCWHEADPDNLATCTRFDTCKKCGTQFGGYNFTDISAHVDENGDSGIVWDQHLGQYRGDDGFFRDGYVHFGRCELCNTYLPIDKDGYLNGPEPCYCVGADSVDCTNGAICDACGGYFVDPMMHSYNSNGICNRYTHFEEPDLNKEEGLYEIENVGNLIWYAQYANSEEYNTEAYGAKLLGDIDFAVLQNYEKLKDFNWVPIGIGEYDYRSTFDGNGFAIKNLRCVSDQYVHLGFIAQASDYNLKKPSVVNLGLVDCYFENTKADQAASAAIVAFSDGKLTIEKCYVENTTVKGAANVGGVAGKISYEDGIRHCYAIDLDLIENEEIVKSWIVREASKDPLNCFAYGENAGVLGASGSYIPKGTYHLNGYNCFYLAENGNVDQDDMKKTAEHFESGLVAWYLGGQFGQTVGVHAHPVLGGETVYRIDVCGGTGFDRYTYSNTDSVSHVWNGVYVCGEAKTCTNCGLTFGEAIEHEYTDVKGNESFIWINDGSYSKCSVQTYCKYCGEANPELLTATVNVNFNGGVRADYVATVHIGENRYSSDVVRIPIITIDEATGIYPSSQIFTGRDYYAADLVTNTKMRPDEYEAYFLLDGEMVGEYALEAGVYDLHIVGRGRYEYQEYTYEDFFTIEKVEVEMTVSVKDKVVDGYKDFEFEITFSNGIDYTEILGVYADQYELPSAEVGEYEITGISYYFYGEFESSISISHNDSAIARILPRNYVEIINKSYKLDYEYGETVPAPKSSDFTVDKGSELTFTWFKDGTLMRNVPDKAGSYTLRVEASATDEYIGSVVEYTVTVQPKFLEIVVDPYGECETETEDLGYDADEDGENDIRVWYLVEMGKTVPLYVVGMPGIDEPVSIHDERFTSTGFYFYWDIYESGAGVEFDEGDDYLNLFPTTPNTVGYRMYGNPHSENSFGVSTDVGFSELYTVDIYFKVQSPLSEVKPVQSLTDYNSGAQEMEFAITIPRWEIPFEDFMGEDGNPTIEYRTHVSGPDGYFVGYQEDIRYLDNNCPTQVIKLTASGEYYLVTTARYTIYRDGPPIEGEKEVVRAKLTVTVTDALGNSVDEIKEIGTYTVTAKTEPCDADGNVIGESAVHSATYRVKRAPREVYLLVKETEIDLDGSAPEYNEKDVVFLTGYTLAPGHKIVDLVYNIELGGYVGAFNMSVITVKGWVIVDEDGNDVSDEYVIYSKLYEWERKYEEVYGKDFENTKNHTVVHAYSNACDATCNIDGCTKTREVEPHKGGVATCTSLAICDVCASEYGGYNYGNHTGDKTVYVRNPDDFRSHDKVYACCGTVISTEEHTITKDATCTMLAECKLCGVVEGSYDRDNHTSEEMYYAMSESDSSCHEYRHSCCHAVKSVEKHEGGEASCTDLAECEICKLGYGSLDGDNHSSSEYNYVCVNTGDTTHAIYHACCDAYVGTEHHYGGEATCTGKAACEACGAEYGDIDTTNHASDEYTYSAATIGDFHYVYYSCCGVKAKDESHSGGEATCKTLASCSFCGVEYGELDAENHESEEYTYMQNASDATMHDKIISCCGSVVATESHSGGEATCKDRAVCEICSEIYGDLADHTYTDACDTDCDVCSAQRVSGHVDADKDRVCDLCSSELGKADVEQGTETDTDTESESEMDTETEDEETGETESEGGNGTETETVVGDETDGGSEGGCGSSIGVGSVTLMITATLAGIALVKRKKEH